ncbi:MAG: efflux RND transporter periplasmic adaptor subunit [Thermoanaerobaculia bacterium]
MSTDFTARPLGTFLAIAILMAVTGGCGGKKPAAAPAGPPPTAVEVVSVTSGTVTESLQALGTVEPAESVKVATEIDAVVKELPFTEGARVRKGQPIAILNDSEPAAEARRTEALRDQAKLMFKRMEDLSGQKIASTQDKDNAEATLKVTDANVNVARARLQKTRILAPFDGVLGQRLVSPGAFLRTGDVITTLSRIDPVKLAFSIPERHRPAMKNGAAVTVTAVAFPARKFTGKVSLIDPSLDPGTRTARVVALIPNPKGELSPGMSAEVTAVLTQRAAALSVPDDSLFAEGERNYVYVVKDDQTVTRREVTLGARQPGTVEVTSGLKAGESIVRAGHQKLFEGAKIQPIEPEPSPASPATSTPAGGTGH